MGFTGLSYPILSCNQGSTVFHGQAKMKLIPLIKMETNETAEHPNKT